MQPTLKMYYVTNGAEKVAVSYSRGEVFIRENGKPTSKLRDCVTIRAKSYEIGALKKIFNDSKNESELQSDYYEKDYIRIFPDNPLFAEACKMAAKRDAKLKATV